MLSHCVLGKCVQGFSMSINQLGSRHSATKVEVHIVHLHFFIQAVELFGQFALGDPALVLRLQLWGAFSHAACGTEYATGFLHLGIFLLLMATGDACHDSREILGIFSWAARTSRCACRFSVMVLRFLSDYSVINLG